MPLLFESLTVKKVKCFTACLVWSVYITQRNLDTGHKLSMELADLSGRAFETRTVTRPVSVGVTLVQNCSVV